MEAEHDLSLSDDDAEDVVGGKKAAPKSTKVLHPGYVPGDTGVVNPASSGMAGDVSGSDDDC